MRHAIFWCGVCVIWGLCLLAGCAGPTEQAEQVVNRYAPEIIGPAERYQSQVEPVGAGPVAGSQVAHVQVTGSRVRPAQGPVIDRFTLSARQVVFQRSPFHILDIGSSTFTAQLRDVDVSAYVNQRLRARNSIVRDFRMTFTPQQARSTALVTLNNREVMVVSTGTFRPDGDARIQYVPDTLTVENVPLPSEVQQTLLPLINPVVDLTGLQSRPQIQQITLGPGIATITGTVTLRNLP